MSAVNEAELGEIIKSGSIKEKVAAMAKLEPAHYDQLRKIVADVSGMRVTTLDTEVAKLRRPAASPNLSFADVEPWGEPVDGAELLDAIIIELRRFLVIPQESMDAVALWLLLTWAVEATFILPMLAISSPQKRCGKSTLLILLRKIARKALLVSNTSSAAIFRIVEKFQPTLLLDEAETWSREDEVLRGILNAGHSRDTAMVLRVDGDALEPRIFNCFCPKALAGIGHLADTIEDRSIIIEMRRRAPNEPVEQLRQDRLNLEHLQRLCARWASDNLQAMRDSDPMAPSELHDRAADNWRPLLRIADIAGGTWPSRARSSSIRLNGRSDDQDSIQILLLADIRKIIEAKGHMKSTDLVAELIAIDDHPWVEWKHGKPITAVQLARQLAPFNICPRAIRVNDKLVVKGYEAAQFDDTFARYLPKSQNRTVTELRTLKNVGFDAKPTVTTENLVTARTVTNFSDVTDQIAGNTEKVSVCNCVTDQIGSLPPHTVGDAAEEF